MKKIKLKDTVKVLSGKDKGKIGQVVKTIWKYNKVVVKGINIITKHKKQSSVSTAKSGRFKVEAPLDISNVMLIDPKTNKPTRVKFRVDKVTHKKVRVSTKTNKIIEKNEE